DWKVHVVTALPGGRDRYREWTAAASDVAQRGVEDAVRTTGGARGSQDAVGAVAVDAGGAEAHAEIALEVLAHRHDARFDAHLAHRDIQLQHQVADRRDALGGVLDQQRVDAGIDRDIAAR